MGSLARSKTSTARRFRMGKQHIAPATAQTPYLTPVDARGSCVPILSAGDTIPGATTADGEPWRFAGIPDGLGAYDNGDGTITVLVNHELGPDQGGAHDNG